MIKSDANIGGATPLENRDETDSQWLELESKLSSDRRNQVTPALHDNSRSLAPELNGSIADRQDRSIVTAELDSMLTSLQRTTPQPPQPNSKPEPSSIVTLRPTSRSEPAIDPQDLLAQIDEACQQLDTAQAQLHTIEQRNQTQVERIDANTLEVKQIKFRIQQLAQHSKNQVEKSAQMLAEIATIRTEIVTSLDKFGGEGEIQQMLSQLEPTRHALILAHDRVVTGQETFYESLQEIQARVTALSQESEAKLRQERELMQSLSQTISIDRLQIAGMSVEMSTKLNELHGLSTQITTIHAQIVEKSQTFQSKIESIERGFAEISQSMQAEKQQFYALTAESIERTDLIRPQLTEISKKIDDDRAKTVKIESAISAIRTNAKQAEEQQLTNFELRDREMILLANNFQIDRNKQLTAIKKMSTWLWVLSGVIAVLFILVLRLSLSLK
ncbi:hypothetical protein [Chamaesiphon sp. GL140_3_metabinner_50]|uniref:hypothetical protein n=1 Tax=Chamaesiphon sp. GL140_3_metabinner_50 TaxID=2970812 RepID=UPI0025D0996D|nr:hypothetical protein [Chamaesiphon sp. GL140_3_metabinner_50]